MPGHLTPYDGGDLEPDEDYDGYLFDGVTFADADAGHCHFLDCSFAGAAFDGGTLRKARFTDVTLRDSRFVALEQGQEQGSPQSRAAGPAGVAISAESAARRTAGTRSWGSGGRSGII